jgi:phenylalanyl-tRNA synthetase beta chain
MKVSLSWLRDYVDFDLSARDLARRLTETLTETEAVASPSAGVTGVVAARVVTVEPHPDAEKLFVCLVDWGGGSAPVVCGAPNTRAGMVSALALPGSTVAGGRRIGKQKLRGRTSHGMLVSGAELGIEGDTEGILDLAPDTELGSDVREILGLADEILDVDEQPNRPDCLSVLGIAREVAVALGADLKAPSVSLIEEERRTSDLATVEIYDPKGCPRSIARVISDVEIAPAPMWIRSRLASVGVRSISNVVDITNFVMLEFGHPIHAFDYDTLAESRIIVRRARKDQRLTTLDGVDRELDPSYLLICDGQRAVALAGIMGGGETEVSDTTRNVLLECAEFDPVVIRRGARRLGLRTEASQRFERGVDRSAMPQVAKRAAALMAELAGGTVARGTVDEGTTVVEEREITLRLEKVRAMLAPGPSKRKIEQSLRRLGFEVTALEERDDFRIGVPAHRADIQIEADLIEEIVRVEGYDSIRPEIPYHFLAAREHHERDLTDHVRDVMVRLGLSEVLTSSFITRKAHERLRSAGEGDPIELANPVNKEMPLLRTSLLPGILEVVRHNSNVGERDIRIFEIGKAFSRADGAHRERWMLAGALSGQAERASWGREGREVDFYDGKGLLWALAEAVCIDSPEVACYDGPLIDGGAAARMTAGGRDVGRFGMLSGEAREAWGLPQSVFVFELELDEIGSLCTATEAYAGIPRYPRVRRDLALVVDEETPAGEVMREVRDLGEPLLTEVDVFDIYRGKQLPAGKKSLGFSLTYMSGERTLTDEEVDEIEKRIVACLVERFNASLRE